MSHGAGVRFEDSEPRTETMSEMCLAVVAMVKLLRSGLCGLNNFGL